MPRYERTHARMHTDTNTHAPHLCIHRCLVQCLFIVEINFFKACGPGRAGTHRKLHHHHKNAIYLGLCAARASSLALRKPALLEQPDDAADEHRH